MLCRRWTPWSFGRTPGAFSNLVAANKWQSPHQAEAPIGTGGERLDSLDVHPQKSNNFESVQIIENCDAYYAALMLGTYRNMKLCSV